MHGLSSNYLPRTVTVELTYTYPQRVCVHIQGCLCVCVYEGG